LEKERKMKRPIRLEHDLVDAIKYCVCPHCGQKLNGRTQIGGEDFERSIETYAFTNSQAQPKAGDVSVCLYCKTKLVFIGGPDGYLRIREMSKEEYEAMPQFVKDALTVDVDELVQAAKDVVQEESNVDFFAKWAKGWKGF
jgi:hypothetical protein